MRDDLEEAYHTAAGRCLEAMLAMRRFNGKGAIEELKSAIMTIEYGQRRAEQKRRRERARIPAAAPIEPPPPPDPFLSQSPFDYE